MESEAVQGHEDEPHSEPLGLMDVIEVCQGIHGNASGCLQASSTVSTCLQNTSSVHTAKSPTSSVEIEIETTDDDESEGVNVKDSVNTESSLQTVDDKNDAKAFPPIVILRRVNDCEAQCIDSDSESKISSPSTQSIDYSSTHLD